MASDPKLVELLEVQSRPLATLTAGAPAQPSIGPEMLMEALASSITEFYYDPENSLTFNAWYDRYEDTFLVDGKNLGDAARIRLLIRKLNPVVYTKYAASILPRNPRDLTFTDTVKTLSTMFGSQESTFSARYRCLQTAKSPQEDLVTYAARVNASCEKFDLTHMSADQFKCLIFVCGLQSHHYAEVRTRALAALEEDANQTVTKLVTMAQRFLNLRKDTALVEESVSVAVNAVSTQNQSSNRSHSQKKMPKTPCWNCGALHYSKYCNYLHHKCTQCGIMGHKEGFCKAYGVQGLAQSHSQQNSRSHRNWRQQPSTQTQSNIVRVNCVTHTARRKFVTVNIKSLPSTNSSRGHDIRLQLDTASDITIIGKSAWEKMGRPGKQLQNYYVTSASNDHIKLLAEFPCEVRLNGEVARCILSVADIDSLHILGRDWCDSFRLWDKPLSSVCNQVAGPTKIDVKAAESTLKQQYSEVFNDNPSTCSKAEVQLQLKPNTKPVFRAKRPVAYAMLPLIDAELQRLQNLGVITPVEFSEYAAPIVAVKKASGKIRICGDYSSGLNAVLESHQYPLPIPQDIYAKIAHSCCFTHIDLSDAYLQTKVTPDSAKLLTINTHKGLFTFTRLAPGIKSAPGAFQQIMDAMLAGIDDTSAYIDDIIIGGSTWEKHYENVCKVLQRLSEYKFSIKFEKCKFFAAEVKYLGNIVTQTGLRPDPEKIKSILNMQRPTNVSEVRSFLGSINYYGKYIRKMSDLRAPIDKLLTINSKFEWTHECEEAFERYKKILNSELMLTHFDPKLPIKVAADASGKGIGAFICHVYPDKSEKVIAHAARTLTSAEKKYSQIEKEALGLIFAVKKFHRYIFGRKFLLCTDHKPLLAIFGSQKGIPVYTANRLQRWALMLMMYDFEIQYVNTKEFGCVDTLSRLMTTESPEEDIVVACARFEKDLSESLNDQFSKLPVSFNMVQQATQNCKILQAVIDSLNFGWKIQGPPELSSYYARRDALCVVNGCLLFNERVVIPFGLQKKILKQLHRGHPGKERMKAVARSHVYWPGIDADVTTYVQNCQKCAAAGKLPAKHTLQSWPMATKPMERLHIDIAGPCNSMYYLVVVDAFSKWPEIFEITNITSDIIINKLNEMFSRYGDCDKLVSDNGTQFVSAKFHEFLELRRITHIRTAPYHPQSNGQAERFVDTLKRALGKLKNEGTSLENLETFLQTYRSTPNPNVPEGISPAEAFLKRKIKTTWDLLKPPSAPQEVKENIAQNNQYNKKHGAQQRDFKAGDLVFARVYRNNREFWVPDTIMERVGAVNYSVLIFDTKKKLIRSHANQLKTRYANIPEAERHPTRILYDTFDLLNTPAQYLTVQSSAESMERSSDSIRLNELLEQDMVLNESSHSVSEQSSCYSTPEQTMPRTSTRRAINLPVWTKDYDLS